VLLAVGSLLALAGCGGDDKAEADESSGATTPSPSPSETFDPVTDGVPTGKWVYRTRTVKSSDPAWFKVGTKSRSVWTFPAACTGEGSCSGEVESSSGFPKSFEWDGSTLVITRATEKPVETTCMDSQSGQVIPGSKVWFHYEYGPQRFEPVAPVDGSAPTEFTGKLLITVKIDRWNDACDLPPEEQDDERETESSTLTLKG